MAELTKLSDLKRRYARDPGGAARSSAALGGARRRAVAPAPDLRDHDAQVGGGAPGAGRRGGPRSPTSSAAGDRGGCRVAALGAAGQPSDLERQGGHAGGTSETWERQGSVPSPGPVLEGARGAAAPGPQIKEAPSQASTNSIVYKI
jgi:hypothetical protein